MQLPVKQKYFILMTIFVTAYPFMVFPLFNIYYASFIKLLYLSLFTFVMWYFLIFQSVKEKRFPGIIQTRGERLAALFLFIICLSTLFSTDPLVSSFGGEYKFQGLLAWFSYISLFLFTYNLVPINKQFNIIRMVVFASFFVGVYGILQHYYLAVMTGEQVESSFVRSWSTFDNPNYFGTYLVILMILAMTLFLSAKKLGESFIYWVIVSTLFLAILFTATRGAWIGEFSGMIILTVLLVWKRRDIWRKWTFLVLSLFFLLFIVDLTENNFFTSRVISIGNDAESVILNEGENGDAGAGRWRIWKTSIPFVKEHFLIGSGPSTFSIEFPSRINEEGEYVSSKKFDNSHNEYLETAITMGIPALLVYIALMVTVLKSGLVAAKHFEGDQEIVAYGLIAAICGYLVQTFFNISVVTVAPFFWVVLGMSYAVSMRVRNKTE
ncbi:O-antigen ligase family protein [Virgibacillus sp. DJP39]|uniref:O-antigen ligase family protein n=1 Tax=Virgibacillus sp. DJP39 TaxID=3409790 RepID=UPI003BB6867D